MKLWDALRKPIEPRKIAGRAAAGVRSYFDPAEAPEKGISRRRVLSNGLKATAATAAASLAGLGAREVVGRATTPDNVVVFVADAMRADCIGKTINGLEVTPHLNLFVKESTYFANAYSAGYTTKPSVASIVTGMFPPGHGVEQNFLTVPACMDITSYYADKGYRTAAIVTNGFLDKEKIMARGTPTTPGSIVGDMPGVAGFGFWRKAGYFAYLDRKESRAGWGSLDNINYSRFDCYIDGGDIVASALAEIDSMRRGRLWRRNPFFEYVHLMETHRPYIKSHAISGVTGRFHNGESAEAAYRKDAELVFRLFYARDFREIRRSINEATPEEVDRLHAIYYESAHYLDRCFGEFIEGLKSRGVYDDTTIVFAGDHGEELIADDPDVDRRILGHERPTLKTLNVPLIIKGREYPAMTVRSRVSTAGILPTLIKNGGGTLEHTSALSLMPAIKGFGHYPIFATTEGRDRAILPDGRSAVIMEAGKVSCRRVHEDGTESKTGEDADALYQLRKLRHDAEALAQSAGIRRRFSTYDWQNPWAYQQRQAAFAMAGENKARYVRALIDVSYGLGIPEEELRETLKGNRRVDINVKALPSGLAEKLRALGYLDN